MDYPRDFSADVVFPLNVRDFVFVSAQYFANGIEKNIYRRKKEHPQFERVSYERAKKHLHEIIMTPAIRRRRYQPMVEAGEEQLHFAVIAAWPLVSKLAGRGPPLVFCKPNRC